MRIAGDRSKSEAQRERQRHEEGSNRKEAPKNVRGRGGIDRDR